MSIVSGVTPAAHKVIANQPLDPATENLDWFWYYNQIQTKTIFDALPEAGMTTSAIFWPVTAGGDIDYLVPEIWANQGDSLPIVKKNSSHNIDDILEMHRQYLYFSDKHKQDNAMHLMRAQHAVKALDDSDREKIAQAVRLLQAEQVAAVAAQDRTGEGRRRDDCAALDVDVAVFCIDAGRVVWVRILKISPHLSHYIKWYTCCTKEFLCAAGL